MREKVFEIEKSGVLNSLDIKKFVTYAQLADLDVTVKDGKINIPKNKDSLKRFLRKLFKNPRAKPDGTKIDRKSVV